MPALSRKSPWLLVAVLALELAAFLPALVQTGVIRTPATKISDGTDAVFTWRVYWRDEVAAGRAPLWNPFTFAGSPAAAEPQLQTFYPVNVLWLWAPPELAYNGLLVLHVLLGSVLMYGLARALGASPFGGAISALAFGLHAQIALFALAGWVMMIAPMAWAPGVLWALVRALDPRHDARRAIAAGGALLGMQLLSGHPEWVRYTLLAGLLFAVFDRRGATVKRRLVAGVAILVLGVLTGAPQLFPTVEAAARSSRGQRAMTVGPALHGAGLPPITLPTMIVPRVFGPWDLHVSTDGFVHKARNAPISAGESLIYVGILPLGLALLAAARSRPAATPWIVIAVTGLLFAMNDVTHLQCALDRLLPPDAVFRSPARFVFMTNLALAVLAGFGATLLETRGVPNRKLLTGGLILAATMAGGAALIIALRARLADALLSRVHIPDEFLARMSAAPDGGAAGFVSWVVGQAGTQVAWAALFLALSLAAGWWFMRAPSTGRSLVVLGVLAFDLALSARPFLTSVVPLDDIYAADLARVAPLQGLPNTRFSAAPGTFKSGPNIAAIARVRSLEGFGTFLLPEYERLHSIAATGQPGALRAMGVTHVLGPDAPLVAIPDAAGRVWWTGRTRAAGSPASAAATLVDAGGLDFVTLEGIADSSASQVGTTSGPVPAVRIDRELPGHVQVQVTAPTDGWLVFTEVFYPGWHARVNGRDVEIRRAFGAMQAVPLPAGTSAVDLRFRPRVLQLGAAAAAVGLLLIAGLLFAARPRQA